MSYCRSFILALLLLLVAAAPRPALANDLAISNLIFYSLDSSTGEMKFDISWSNSWRTTSSPPNNWDAAWIFAKVRVNGGSWRHLYLATSGHSAPSSPIAVTLELGLVDPGAEHNSVGNPVVGTMLYRSSDGVGTLTANLVKLRWSYADNAFTSADTIEIRLFATEMVYVSDGAFYAGDGSATATGVFKQGSSDSDPWYISSEDAISVSNVSSNGYYYVNSGGGSSEYATGASFTIPATFPKGFRAFYIMKGEASQSQYVGFFNTLTATQKTNRDITSSTGKNTDNLLNGNSISWDSTNTSLDATLPNRGGGADYSAVAVGFLNIADTLAFYDWSGLRPMSELEFEKAARGPLAAVAGEYSWGTTTINTATSLSNAGLPSERGNSGSNVNGPNSALAAPVRVGSFASGVNTRQASGGGYYGAMELSGNIIERTVTVGRSLSHTFHVRRHGDGVLTSAGEHNDALWPSSADAHGFRGGAFGNVSGSFLTISDRIYAATVNSGRNRGYGARGVRTAPRANTELSFNSLLGLGTNSEDASLQGIWNLQEATGTAATDASSKGRNGTIVGMGSNPATATGPNNWLPSSFNLDGTDDYVDINSNLGITAYPFSFVLFFSLDQINPPVEPCAISFLDLSRSDRYYGLWFSPNSQRMGIGARNTTSYHAVGTPINSLNSWTHVAGVYETDTSKKLFLNGVHEATLTDNVTFSTTVNRLLLGRIRNIAGFSSQFWDGRLAGAVAFSRALSHTEINELRLGPEPVNTAAPVLSGSATQGQSLSATTGTWGLDDPFASGSNGTIYYSYQWTRSDNNSGLNETNISGATSSSYTLSAADVGKYIRCYVRAGNDGGYDRGAGVASGFSALVS